MDLYIHKNTSNEIKKGNLERTIDRRTNLPFAGAEELQAQDASLQESLV
jgi:hypothetical protein